MANSKTLDYKCEAHFVRCYSFDTASENSCKRILGLLKLIFVIFCNICIILMLDSTICIKILLFFKLTAVHNAHIMASIHPAPPNLSVKPAHYSPVCTSLWSTSQTSQ